MRLPRLAAVGKFALHVAMLTGSGAFAQIKAQSWGQYGVTVHSTNAGYSPFRQINNTMQILADQPIGSIGGSFSQGYGINNLGQVAGYGYTSSDAELHALFYDGTNTTDIGTLGGMYSAALGLNDFGRLVGGSYLSGDQYYHAFLYDGTTMQDLGTLYGTSGQSEARAINGAGQIVGFTNVASGALHAFLYDGSGMHDLGTLGGTFSQAWGINSTGLVVGDGYTGSNQFHGFIYDGATMTDLGTLGGTTSSAFGISNAGTAVGFALDALNAYHGAIWENSGSGFTPYNLDNIVNTGSNSGWVFNRAWSISDNDQYILASANHNGQFAGIVALEANAAPVTATPEPASLALLGTGLVALCGGACFRRRRARSWVDDASPMTRGNCFVNRDAVIGSPRGASHACMREAP